MERRRTLVERLNNWKVRNDSTNVSLLMSGDHLTNTIKAKNKEKKSPCQTCYCRKSPVLSKFNMKPQDSRDCGYRSPVEGRRHRQLNATTPQLVVVTPRREENRSTPASPKKRYVASDPPPIVYEEESSKELEELELFRKDNYFECHSSTNLEGSAMGDHKCVHRFVLNNRLIPEPLNPDPFGTSRCLSCNRPMENWTEAERPNDSRELVRRERSNDVKLKGIKITGESGVTEIQIPPDFNKMLELFQNTVRNVSKARPTNTLALRHQKGVVLN